MLNNPQNYIFSSSVSQLITTNIFKMANLGAGLIHPNNINNEFPALNNPKNYMFISSVSQLITTNIFKMAAAAILNLDTGFGISQIIKITSNMDSVSSITPEIMY